MAAVVSGVSAASGTSVACAWFVVGVAGALAALAATDTPAIAKAAGRASTSSQRRHLALFNVCTSNLKLYDLGTSLRFAPKPETFLKWNTEPL
ncbi:MAG: hypothetical protein ACR2MZ_01280 [Candidatus Dormibacter sp.]|uniref:hypothetical protein n=1 Tax=Candidatus Dormibacter sp. TaxID=2973982 RepID=UPI003D9B2E4D